GQERAATPRSPHFTQNFAAHTFFARLSAGHDTAWRGQDVDPQPAEHTGNLIASHIHATAGPRNALQVGDGGGIVIPVFQVNAEDLSALLFRRLEIGDVAFFFQNARDLQLQL